MQLAAWKPLRTSQNRALRPTIPQPHVYLTSAPATLEEEAKKLDTYNTRKKHADMQIDWANQELKKIVEDVSANR